MMGSKTARERADEFLKISDQFRLGELVTEQPHPTTANLSEVAKHDTAAALDLLFQVDGDVVEKYREWVESGRSGEIAKAVTDALLAGGRIFFTGCGATGRLSILLDSIWRDYWQRAEPGLRDRWADRTVSIMAGGDFALIKSVEGFEDITAFGRRQIAEHNVGPGDVVFAITEGGETSWVIGTAWEALDGGAKVYFVYNNPDDVLCEHVQRSREIIEEPRIEKINVTTGPMAITGSTRMQATSIELCVMLTILEMALRGVTGEPDSPSVPAEFLQSLEEVYSTLRSQPVLSQLARLVEMEEGTYRRGGKVNYFADSLAIDVLTDTTERSPTFCTPPFRKVRDTQASESWAFLFLPYDDTETAWNRMLKRAPKAVEWPDDVVSELVGPDDAPRRSAVIKNISQAELYRFMIGLDGLEYRQLGPGDGAVVVSLFGRDKLSLLRPDGPVSAALAEAASAGASVSHITFASDGDIEAGLKTVVAANTLCVPAPKAQGRSVLGFATRIAAKMLLNALSTCVMVRLGRVMGNYMIYVVPSNLKLIDRATRYITKLADMPYDDACRLLFEVIEYVEPRMETNQAYPPVVGMAVMRAKFTISNEEAEARLGDGNIIM